MSTYLDSHLGHFDNLSQGYSRVVQRLQTLKSFPFGLQQRLTDSWNHSQDRQIGSRTATNCSSAAPRPRRYCRGAAAGRLSGRATAAGGVIMRRATTRKGMGQEEGGSTKGMTIRAVSRLSGVS